MPITPFIYRTAIVVTLVALLVALAIPAMGMIRFEPEVEAARSWSYFGATLPMAGLVAWQVAWAVLVLTGLIGSLFFWNPARFSLAAAAVLTMLSQPLLGLVVYSSFEATASAIGGTLMLWVTTVSFWSALANRFTRGASGAP